MKPQIIIFNVSKKQFGNPGTNMKKIVKKYKDSYKIGLNKEAVQYDRIKQANLFVIASPRQNFAKPELQSLKKYVQNGGNLLILLSQGGQRKNNTNLNILLQPYGITANNDCVLRTSFYKYFHPKEAYIHNGILNEEIVRVVNGYSKEPKVKNNAFLMGGRQDDQQQYQKEAKRTGVEFVYVNGCTFNVQLPAQPILSSGPLTYPSNKPIGVVFNHKSKGKLLICGSIESFLDDYFDLEENNKLFDFFLKFFLSDEVGLEFSKDQSQQNPEQNYVPDVGELADGLKSCFQQSEDIPRDFTTLFQSSLFKYDTNLIPDAVKLYTDLGVKHQPLTLIVPQFQTPMMGLAPAVFPPILRQLPNPSLQEFDLDDEFALQKVRLAQLTNKCENKDLQYFVKQAGDMLGISDKVKNRSEPKSIIKYLLQQIINFKRMNPN